MAMHLLVLGLIAAVSGVLAIVANQRIEPFYSYILRSIPQIQVNFVPRVRALYSARKAIANNGTLRIRGHIDRIRSEQVQREREY